MRVLILLQGVPGSGKSTFVKQMGFEPIIISTDDLRLLHGSPVMSEDGSYSIDQKLSGKAWGPYGSGLVIKEKYYSEYKRKSKFVKFVDKWHNVLFGVK